MNKFVAVIGIAALAGLASCKTSYGPAFDPHAPPKGPEEAALPETFRTADGSFQTITRTNLIKAEWRQTPTNFFRLGPGDTIEIEILGDPQSRVRSMVGPDGKIYFSLLPGLFIWGKTLNEAKTIIDTELQRYILNGPQVGIMLQAVGSKRIWILGNVQAPGVYSLATPMTLLEALTTAGGAIHLPGSREDAADLKRSFVMRNGELLQVDFHKLLREGDFSQNIYLQPDDFVFVRSAESSEVYVLGALARPNVVPFTEQMSLVSAVALAGGPISYAYTTHTAIIRGSLTEPKIAIVDLNAIRKGQQKDVLLQPGDIVYLPFSPYRKIAQFADEILSQFVRTVAVNEGQNAIIKNGTPVGVSVGVGF